MPVACDARPRAAVCPAVQRLLGVLRHGRQHPGELTVSGQQDHPHLAVRVRSDHPDGGLLPVLRGVPLPAHLCWLLRHCPRPGPGLSGMYSVHYIVYCIPLPDISQIFCQCIYLFIYFFIYLLGKLSLPPCRIGLIYTISNILYVGI